MGTEAPAFFVWDEDTHLLYVSSVGSEGNGTLRVLQNSGQDLLQGWKDLGEMRDSRGEKMVYYDAFAFAHPNGRRYL